MKSKALFLCLVLALLLTLMLTTTAFAAAPNQTGEPITVPPEVVMLVQVLAGSLAVPIITQLKQLFQWTNDTDGKKNIWLSFGVCLLLGVLALAVTGKFAPITNPMELIYSLGLAFSTATLIYKNLSQQAPK
jgi:hypothetical protein